MNTYYMFNFNNDNDKKIFLNNYRSIDNFYNIINEYYIPSAYIPFNTTDNTTGIDDINVDILSNGIKFIDNDFDFDNLVIKIDNKDINEKNTTIKTILNTTIKHINNPEKIYNKFDMTKITYMTFIMWIFIIFCIFKYLYYYAYQYYGVIIILFTTMLLIFSVLWKIYTTMQDI